MAGYTPSDLAVGALPLVGPGECEAVLTDPQCAADSARQCSVRHEFLSLEAASEAAGWIRNRASLIDLRGFLIDPLLVLVLIQVRDLRAS